MIKRASTILLTLFLLLTSAQVWGQGTATPVWADPAGKTNYKVNGATSLNEVNILNTLYESSSTSCSFNISSSGLKITTSKGEKKFTYTFSGVASNATDKKCTITLKLGSSTNVKYRIVTYQSNGNEDYSMSYDYHGGGTKTITTYAKGSSASFRIDFDEDNKTMLIEEISIKCQILPTILVPAVFMGEDVTLTAAGLKSLVKWYYQPKGGSTWIDLGSGESITTDKIKENGTIKAIDGNGKEYKESVYVTIRCKGTLIPDFKETFKINGDRGLKGDIVSTALNGGSRFNTNYKSYTEGANARVADEEEYMIVKSSDNTFDGWEIGNNSNGTPIKGHSDDGFMIINCNTISIKDGEDKYLFQLDINGLCQYTRYNFSAFIMNICQDTESREPVNVLFRVYGLNGGNLSSEPLLNLPTGDISNPDSKWHEHKGSVYTGTYTSVRLLLYNNNTDAEVTTRPDGTKFVNGNDVAIDDIEFSRCTPEIGVYTEDPTTNSKPATSISKCNDGTESIDLYVGNPEYSLNHFMQTAYYVLQEKRGSGNWTTVKVNGNEIVSNSEGFAKYTLTIESGQEETQYRAIVASKEQAARDLMTKSAPDDPDCVSYYKMQGNFASVKMVCANPCTEVDPLKVEPYDNCPTPGTKTLYSLLKNPLSSKPADYEWQKFDANGANPTATANSFDTNDTNSSGKYRVRRPNRFTDSSTGVEYCPTDWTEFNITVSENTEIKLIVETPNGPVEYGPSSTYTICAGDEVTLKTSYEPNPTNGESVTWEQIINGVNTTLTGTSSSIKVTPTEKTTYKATIENSCKLPGSIIVDLTTVKKPVLKADNESICLGSPIKITDTVTETAGKYEWYVKKDNGNWEEISGITSKNLESYSPESEGKYSFKSIATNDQCSEESDPISVEVGAPITYTLSEPTTICESSTSGTTVYVKDINPATAKVQWYDNNNNKIGDEDNLTSVNVTPSDDTTYKVSLWIEGGCTAKDSVKITVDGSIDAKFPRDTTICLGASTTLTAGGGTKYTWSSDKGYYKVETSGYITIKPDEATDYTYSVKIDKGTCSVNGKATVSVKSLPQINSIVVKTNDEDQREIVLDITSDTDYEVSIDGENYGIPSAILENVPIGWNLLYVKDENECESNKQFYVEPIDIKPEKYFTPNGDGKNEEWNVEKLNLYSSYIVEIFDRHGKRLFVQYVGSFNTGGQNTVEGDEFTGWNGEYNGHDMPSDDYWYLITVEEIRKQYTGHFTLKR